MEILGRRMSNMATLYAGDKMYDSSDGASDLIPNDAASLTSASSALGRSIHRQ